MGLDIGCACMCTHACVCCYVNVCTYAQKHLCNVYLQLRQILYTNLVDTFIYSFSAIEGSQKTSTQRDDNVGREMLVVFVNDILAPRY